LDLIGIVEVGRFEAFLTVDGDRDHFPGHLVLDAFGLSARKIICG
jgi:hypothetical protein